MKKALSVMAIIGLAASLCACSMWHNMMGG